jgi:hypothetical protein
MSEEHFTYPKDFPKMKQLEDDPGTFEKVEEKPGKGPCGGPSNAAAGYGEAVKDCNNVPEEEKNRIGQKAVDRLRDAVIRSCRKRDCRLGSVTPNYHSTSCRNNHYTVVVGCKFTCVK